MVSAISKFLGFESRGSIEDPNVPINSSNILNFLGIAGSDSGVAVNGRNVLTYAPVYSAISMISGDVAKLPIEVYRRRPDLSDTAREIDRNHQSYRLVCRQPKSGTHAFSFWREMMVDALIYHNAYAWIRRNPMNGRPLEMIPLLPDRTYYDAVKELYFSDINDQVTALYQNEVFHIQGLKATGYEPQLVTLMRDSIGLGLAAQKFNSRFFKNNGHAGGVLEIPPHFTKKAADNLEQGWRERTGPDEWFKAVILREGAKFHRTTIEPDKAQLTELRTDQVVEVARWYNLAPSRLGVEGATSYGSKAEDNRDYHDRTLSSHLCSIVGECGLKLTTKKQRDDDSHFFQHDLSVLFASDLETQAKVGRTEIEMGALSPNEYRSRRNLNPREGGDIYLTPLNLGTNAGQEDSEPDDSVVVDDPNENPGIEDKSHEAIDVIVRGQAQEALKGLANRVRREINRKSPGRCLTWFDRVFDDERSETEAKIADKLSPFVKAYQGDRPGSCPNAIASKLVGQVRSEIAPLFELEESKCAAAVLEACDNIAANQLETLFDGET